MLLCPAKLAKWIEVLFGVETLGEPIKVVLDWGQIPHGGRGEEEGI